MKDLLLTLCFVCITSLIFCQTPAPQNTQVHLKYYAHNCGPLNSFTDANKSVGNETEISSNKSLAYIANGYCKLTGYNVAFSIGQNKWHNTAPVVKSWQYLNSSIKNIGFRGNYFMARGTSDNYTVFDSKLSL
jgi:hypothetical protein